MGLESGQSLMDPMKNPLNFPVFGGSLMDLRVDPLFGHGAVDIFQMYLKHLKQSIFLDLEEVEEDPVDHRWDQRWITSRSKGRPRSRGGFFGISAGS